MNLLQFNLEKLSVTTSRKRITTSDGFKIVATCYEPLHVTDQVVLIGSATGVHQEYYRTFAHFLAEKGYTVYTFDYRGVGKSRPTSLKNIQADMQTWGKSDLDAMIAYIREENPLAKLTYIGHSISGQLLALTQESIHISKVILVATQHVNWRLWPLYARFVYAFLMYFLMPLVSHIVGYFPGKQLKIFWDLPKGVALEWARWCRSRNGMFSYHSDEQIKSLKMPLLAIGFSDDVIAPFRPMNELLNKYSHAAITQWQYKPSELGVRKIGHFGFFRSSFKNNLWRPVLEWMEQTERFEKPLMGSLLSNQTGVYGYV